jgi:hypothetical protein
LFFSSLVLALFIDFLPADSQFGTN